MSIALQPAPEIPLRHGSSLVTLRGSLRAAVALDNLPGGIPALWDALARQKITAIHAVIRASASDRQQAETLIADTATKPLEHFVMGAQAACLALVASLLNPPSQGEAPDPAKSTGPAITLGEFFAQLFSLATSWLHWPPSEVWNASVSEIVTALEAQADRDLRRAGVERPDKANAVAARKANTDAGLDPDFDRAGLQSLKSLNQR